MDDDLKLGFFLPETGGGRCWVRGVWMGPGPPSHSIPTESGEPLPNPLGLGPVGAGALLCLEENGF